MGINNSNYLDKVRFENGNDGLKNFYRTLSEQSTEKAIKLINDESLRFSSIYVLHPEIVKSGLDKHLNERNKCASDIINMVMSRNEKTREETKRYSATDYKNLSLPVLKWILFTGCNDSSPDNKYDEVIDFSAAVAVKIHKDNSVLPCIARIIYDRNKKNKLIHNLVWAFYECNNPYCLGIIASRFLSANILSMLCIKYLLV